MVIVPITESERSLGACEMQVIIGVEMLNKLIAVE